MDGTNRYGPAPATATGPDTSPTSATSTDAGLMDTGSTDASATTGGLNIPCHLATTQQDCESTGDGVDESCGWFEVSTWVVGLEGTCSDLEMSTGYCFVTSQGDDGCGSIGESTCPDGDTVVYYNPVGLEIGAVEIFAETELNFEMCTFDGEILDPPECECGCPG